MIPCPFTDALFLYGDPIRVGRPGDAAGWEGEAARVTAALNDLERRAEGWLKENP